jgi:glutathione synthase/RimK-type ligase-like ATP-grasp enzyme
MNAEAPWPPRLAQEARLRHLDDIIAAAPDAIEARVERAALLYALDRPDEARAAYLDSITREPTHFAALNDFATMLAATGFKTAARTLYVQAVAHHPDNPKGHVNLANLLLHDADLAGARANYETALRLDPTHPQAHQGLATVLTELGDVEGADRHRRVGFARESVTTLPYRGTKPPVRILMLVSANGGNIPTAPFLDNRTFLTTVVVAEFFDAAAPLPLHHVVFNTIGDADLCEPALEAACAIVVRTGAPIVNHPRAVLATGRAANARRLSALDGVAAPRIATLSRPDLAGPDSAAELTRRGFAFPLLLRAPGFHTGRNFVLVETADALAAAAAGLPGDELLAIEYLDARGADGMARKYRIMVIDGRIYPLHLAISRQWKVHYFTSDMAEHDDYRAQEAAFLTDMPASLGTKAIAALTRIRDVLALDYGGVDFGLSPSGDVLLFEANATMVVNEPDADARWDYRRPAVAAILDAARAMLIGRANSRDALAL